MDMDIPFENIFLGFNGDKVPGYRFKFLLGDLINQKHMILYESFFSEMSSFRAVQSYSSRRTHLAYVEAYERDQIWIFVQQKLIDYVKDRRVFKRKTDRVNTQWDYCYSKIIWMVWFKNTPIQFPADKQDSECENNSFYFSPIHIMC